MDKVEREAIKQDRKLFEFNLKVLREAFRLRSGDAIWTARKMIEDYLGLVLAKGGRWALDYAERAMAINGVLIQHRLRQLTSPQRGPTPEQSYRSYSRRGRYGNPAPSQTESQASSGSKREN